MSRAVAAKRAPIPAAASIAWATARRNGSFERSSGFAGSERAIRIDVLANAGEPLPEHLRIVDGEMADVHDANGVDVDQPGAERRVCARIGMEDSLVSGYAASIWAIRPSTVFSYRPVPFQ